MKDDNYHIVCMSLLGAFGLLLNIVYFLAGINVKHSVISSIEFLRRFKTVVAILGLSIYIPVDIFFNFWTGENWIILCSLRGMLQRVFLDSQVMVVLSLAVVRLRLSCCKQITILLVDNSPTYITLFVLLLLPITNAVTTFVSFLPDDDANFLSYKNNSEEIVSNSSHIRMICRQQGIVESTVMPYIVMDLIPLVISCGIYFAIIFRISKNPVFPNRVFSDVRQFNRRRFRNEIKMAFSALLVMLLFFWLPYTATEIRLIISNEYININVFRILAYLKIGIFLLHPFSDGGFKRFRQNLQAMRIFYSCIKLQGTTVHPATEQMENVTPYPFSPEDIPKGNFHNPLNRPQLTIQTGNDCIQAFDDIMIIDDEIDIGEHRLNMRNSRSTVYLT